MSTELTTLLNQRSREQVVWVRDTTKVIILKVDPADADKAYDIVVRLDAPYSQQCTALDCHLQVLPHGAIVQEMYSSVMDTTTVETSRTIEVRQIEEHK